MNKNYSKNLLHIDFSKRGFTLIELLVVLIAIGITGLIAAPSFQGLIHRHKLNQSQSQAHQLIRTTQFYAKQQKRGWQTSFRSVNSRVEMAMHPVDIVPTSTAWQVLPYDIQIDNETTFRRVGNTYQVQFNHRGHVNGQLGRLTFSIRNSEKLKRCIITSTLLGTLRTAKENSRPDQSGRYCY